jgi:hypothetical protein
MQTRPHALVLASRDGVYVALVQDHERQPQDDSTAVLGPVFASVEIEGEYETGASLRRLAGELLNAAGPARQADRRLCQVTDVHRRN